MWGFVVPWVMNHILYIHINVFTLLALKRSPSPMDLPPGGVLARSCVVVEVVMVV